MMKIYHVCRVRLENKHFIIYLTIPCVGTSEYMEGKNLFTQMGDISMQKDNYLSDWHCTHEHMKLQTLYIYIYKPYI